MFAAEFSNLVANVAFCYENECDLDANKWILSDGKITVTCIKYGCYVKVDNFNLKFKKTKTGYVELDVTKKGMDELILKDNPSPKQRFKAKEDKEDLDK